MQVRFFAYLREFTGCAEADVPYRETAGALAQTLCELYGKKLQDKIKELEAKNKAGLPPAFK